MIVSVIIASVVASVIVEVFRHHSMKKEEPKTTWGGVLSYGAEQLLIVFLSAFIALFFANTYENQKANEQIIKVLDVAEEQLKMRLSGYSAALSRIEEDDFDSNRKKHSEQVLNDFAMVSALMPLDIDLKDFLFSQSVLIRVEPEFASNIGKLEKELKYHEEKFMDYFREPESNQIPYMNTMNDIEGKTATLIIFVELEKIYLKGKPIPQDIFSETNMKTLMGAESWEDYDLFHKEFFRFSDEDFRGWNGSFSN